MRIDHPILVLCIYLLGIGAAVLLGVLRGWGLDIAIAVAFGLLLHIVLMIGFAKRQNEADSGQP